MKDFIKNLNRTQKIILLIGLFIAMLLVFLVLYKVYYDDEPNYNTNEEITDAENSEQQQSKLGILISNGKVVVHVTGEVNTPGVVTLNSGARIWDAIKAAGGETDNADLSNINLAYVIEDGVQIRIPNIKETTDTKNTDAKEIITTGAGSNVIYEEATKDKANTKPEKININTADAAKLQTLPGIGAEMAKKIIEHRKNNGKFKTIEEFKNVPGIGESKFNALKDLIKIQ